MASDFFSDKKYENLDWISQAVEPWEWSVLDNLRQLPETIEITAADISANYDSYYGFAWTKMLLTMLSGDHSLNDSDLTDYIKGLYKVEIETGTVVDFTDGTLSNPIRLVKQKPTLSDEECLKFAASTVYANGGSFAYDLRDSEQYARAGEILDLIGANMTHARGHRNRRHALDAALRSVFAEDKWRIRSMPLVEKIGTWVRDYIRNGDISAMANFAKLKVMTHAGKPLYSIVEVE